MLITPKKALEIVLGNVRPLEATRRPLDEAVGWCLAEEVRADRDSPPTDRSAMDGYAVRCADIAGGGGKLRLVGEVAAGSAKRPKVSAGTCVSILTGARVPAGADAVVKVEETRQEGGEVVFLTSAKSGANIRKRGEEVRKGQVVLSKGTVLDAVQIGLCASVGKAFVRVHRRPRCAILSTGEELCEPEESVRAHQLRDANGPALCAALRARGYLDVSRRIVPDAPDVLASALKAASEECDAVILSGGVSVGKYDFVPEALRRLGAIVQFHGVAMKPGKPQLYATLGDACHVFGLPGNPLSVLTGLHEIVLPALRRMSGVPVESSLPSLRVPLAKNLSVKGSRANFVLARLERTRNGSQVKAVKSRGSADLASGAKADGMIVVRRNVSEVPAGTLVEFHSWRAAP